MGLLDGKVAIVTGAASGIGRASAIRFACEGARVILADRNEEAGQEAAQLIRGQGDEAAFVIANVADPVSVAAMVETTVATYGRLDVLLNNAGIGGREARTADYSLDDWDLVMKVNLKGVFLVMKYAIPAMIRGGGGSIVNVASVMGLIGLPGHPAYCASKAGVIELTRTTALEYAKSGIRVNAICPGVILTKGLKDFVVRDEASSEVLRAMHPIGRFGKEDEVVDLILFLASDKSSFCTGAHFVADGGLTAA